MDAPYVLPTRRQSLKENINRINCSGEGENILCEDTVRPTTVFSGSEVENISPSVSHSQSSMTSSDDKAQLKKQNLIIHEQRKELNQLKVSNEKLQEGTQVLEDRVSTFKPHNVLRKLQRRDQEINNLKEENETISQENERLENNVSFMKGKLDQLRSQKKRYQASAKYYRQMREEGKELSTSCDENVQDLLETINELSEENQSLKDNINEVMGEKDICTFKGGRFTDELRLVIYDLLSRRVGSAQVGPIIQTVVKGLTDQDIERLPKPTVVKYMAAEAGLLAKASAASKVCICLFNPIIYLNLQKKPFTVAISLLLNIIMNE